jgi:hypothetical protein
MSTAASVRMAMKVWKDAEKSEDTYKTADGPDSWNPPIAGRCAVRMSVPQKIKFKKQYKPIKFGDRPDPGTVEGHRNAMIEAAETRAYNRRMKELAAEDVARREGYCLGLRASSHLSRGGTDLCLTCHQYTSIPAKTATKCDRSNLAAGPFMLVFCHRGRLFDYSV